MLRHKVQGLSWHCQRAESVWTSFLCSSWSCPLPIVTGMLGMPCCCTRAVAALSAKLSQRGPYLFGLWPARETVSMRGFRCPWHCVPPPRLAGRWGNGAVIGTVIGGVRWEKGAATGRIIETARWEKRSRSMMHVLTRIQANSKGRNSGVVVSKVYIIQ